MIPPQRKRRRKTRGWRRERGKKKEKMTGDVRRRGRGRGKGNGEGEGAWDVGRNHHCLTPGMHLKSTCTNTTMSWKPPCYICCQPCQPFLLHWILKTHWPLFHFSKLPWSLSPQSASLCSLSPLSQILFPLPTTTLYPANLTLAPPSFSQGSHTCTSLALAATPAGPESFMLWSHSSLPWW